MLSGRARMAAFTPSHSAREIIRSRRLVARPPAITGPTWIVFAPHACFFGSFRTVSPGMSAASIC